MNQKSIAQSIFCRLVGEALNPDNPDVAMREKLDKQTKDRAARLKLTPDQRIKALGLNPDEAREFLNRGGKAVPKRLLPGNDPNDQLANPNTIYSPWDRPSYAKELSKDSSFRFATGAASNNKPDFASFEKEAVPIHQRLRKLSMTDPDHPDVDVLKAKIHDLSVKHNVRDRESLEKAVHGLGMQPQAFTLSLRQKEKIAKGEGDYWKNHPQHAELAAQRAKEPPEKPTVNPTAVPEQPLQKRMQDAVAKGLGLDSNAPTTIAPAPAQKPQHPKSEPITVQAKEVPPAPVTSPSGQIVGVASSKAEKLQHLTTKNRLDAETGNAIDTERLLSKALNVSVDKSKAIKNWKTAAAIGAGAAGLAGVGMIRSYRKRKRAEQELQQYHQQLGQAALSQFGGRGY